jgi:hypothetical protein
LWIVPSFGGMLFDVIKDGDGQHELSVAPPLCVLFHFVRVRLHLGLLYGGVSVCIHFVAACY